jgi:hypothetical protein
MPIDVRWRVRCGTPLCGRTSPFALSQDAAESSALALGGVR